MSARRSIGSAYRVAGAELHLAGRAEGIGPKLAEIGRTADEAGFASLWVMDHFSNVHELSLSETFGEKTIPAVAEL